MLLMFTVLYIAICMLKNGWYVKKLPNYLKQLTLLVLVYEINYFQCKPLPKFFFELGAL